MGHSKNTIRALHDYLIALPDGKAAIVDKPKSDILMLLAECWQSLKGSDQHKTFPEKVCRAENLKWKPPVLCFELERHGALINGSSRADVHHWEINLDRETAAIVKNGHRQVDKMSPRMDTQAKALETANKILSGLDDPTLTWKGNRDYVIINIGKIIPEQVLRTTQDRRTRFKGQLEKCMLEQGWVRKDQGKACVVLFATYQH